MFLDTLAFAKVVANAPLISIDLIIHDKKQIMLGLRNNEPAKGFWFVPGGRILKDEKISNAFIRLLKKELNIDINVLKIENTKFIGVFEHFYPNCFGQQFDHSTHYVVLAYSIFVEDLIYFTFERDNQHSKLKWWTIEKATTSNFVHQYTKNYFNSLQNLIY